MQPANNNNNKNKKLWLECGDEDNDEGDDREFCARQTDASCDKSCEECVFGELER